MTGVSRRDMLNAVARWTVPTVVTLTLGARILEAKASCPPCQKKVGATCRACTISQMLNCSCEPCLGPPYCAAVGPVAPAVPLTSAPQAPGSQSLVRPQPGASGAPSMSPYLQSQREQALRQRDPFRQPVYTDPFGAQRRDQPTPGLYQRLRPDSSRRLP
jgi:hypothetical protein